MKMVSSARTAASVAVLALSASVAVADDKNVKIGVLSDMAGLYADLAGPGSVLAANMAVEDSGLKGKGWNVSVVSGDHQNKPDIGTSVTRQWIDVEKVDMITDTPNSGVALAVSNVAKEKNIILMNSGGGSSDLTGKGCTPNTISIAYDTYMLASGTGKALTKTGGNTWFFLTADYAFGAALQRDTTAAVDSAGGKIVGSVKHPLNTADFSSFLLQAQSSGAKVVGLANAGGDTTNAIKQAAEFGLTQSGQKLAALLLFLQDVHGLGLNVAQGLTFTESFYWDLNDKTRAWSKKYQERSAKKSMPSMVHAGVYAAVLHYLKTLDSMGGNSHDGAKVVAAMKKLPVEDDLFGKSEIRADGRRAVPAYLFEVKKPSESKGPWDYYKTIATLTPEEVTRPLSESECPLVKK